MDVVNCLGYKAMKSTAGIMRGGLTHTHTHDGNLVEDECRCQSVVLPLDDNINIKNLKEN